MLAEISAGLSSLKAAKDIVQGLNAAKTEAAINGVKIDLQGHILDAQQGLFAAQEAQSTDARRIAQPEQEIVGLKDWSAGVNSGDTIRGHNSGDTTIPGTQYLIVRLARITASDAEYSRYFLIKSHSVAAQPTFPDRKIESLSHERWGEVAI